MTVLIKLCVAVLIALLPIQVAVADGARAQVMILGTFHFEGSPTDGVSVTMGDITSDRRQAELREVIDRLARFQPTRIMVEVSHQRQAELDARYRAFLEGTHTLGHDEVDQLGMRLAQRLGLTTLHAVDAQQGMDFERMMKAGGAAGQQDLLAWFQSGIASVEATLSEAQSEDKTLLDALRFHNGPWTMDGNGLYLKLVALGTSEDPAGAEVIGGWYQRNLKIFANIARAIPGPDERVLVIYGSGHLAHLSDFVDQHPDYELVSALRVLGTE